MARIPLHFLPTFVAVAEGGGLRQAAAALHLTHSAVSQQVNELESRLGFPVFDRRARRLVLNDAGALLLQGARAALADIDESVRRAGEVARRSAGTLRLTMPVAFAQRWFLPRLARWQARHPDTAIEVDASPAVRDLQRDGFDAAIRSSAGAPGLWAGPLYEAPCRQLAVAAPAVAERLTALGPASLHRERLFGPREDWTHWFEVAGVPDGGTTEAPFSSLTLLLDAAEQGLGVGLAREILVADAIRRGSLRPLFEVAWLRADVPPHALVCRTPPAPGSALAALHDWLREEAVASLG